MILSVLSVAPIAVASTPPRSAELDLSEYCDALNTYFEAVGSYPEQLQYMFDRYPTWRMIKHPWGRDYLYSLSKPDIASKDAPYYIWTLGKDGTVGGSGDDADIGNWNVRYLWALSCKLD